jgi:hypothetical protein
MGGQGGGEAHGVAAPPPQKKKSNLLMYKPTSLFNSLTFQVLKTDPRIGFRA